MAKKNPFKILPLDVESFLLSTAHMDNAAVGAYARILFKGWLDLWPVGTFPTDEKTLAEMAQSDDSEWERIKSSVKRRFKQSGDSETMIQERLKSTFTEVKKKTEDARIQRSKAGKASAAARAQHPPNGRSTPVNNRIEPNQIELKRIEPNQTKSAAGPPGVREVLKWAEVGGGLKKCLAVDGLTPIVALIQAERNKRSGGEPGGLVNKLCDPRFTPAQLIHPEIVATLARRGRIAKVCGHEIHSNGDGSNVSFSNHELVIVEAGDDVRLHETKLLAEEIEVRLDGVL